MVAIGALITLFLAVGISLFTIRVGTVALTMTGLDPDVASFQALSAFSGVGFTTTEAEDILADPARRKVVRYLMLAGGFGIITTISSIVLAFTESREVTGVGVIYMIGGVGAIVLFSRSRWFNRLLTPIIRRQLSRSTTLELRDYTRLLRIRGGYRVAELFVESDHELSGETLGDLVSEGEGVLVLGIDRSSGEYIGTPGSEVRIHPGDIVYVYGRKDRLRELAEREENDVDSEIEDGEMD